MVVREGGNETLVCAARGSPPPVITWRRENNLPFTVGAGPEGKHSSLSLCISCLFEGGGPLSLSLFSWTVVMN